LPDLVGQLLSGVAEFAVDGSELLGLGDIDGAFDHVADGLLDLGSKLRHDSFDALFTRLVRWGRGGMRRHGQTPVVKNGCSFASPSSLPRRRDDFPPK